MLSQFKTLIRDQPTMFYVTIHSVLRHNPPCFTSFIHIFAFVHSEKTKKHLLNGSTNGGGPSKFEEEMSGDELSVRLQCWSTFDGECTMYSAVGAKGNETLFLHVLLLTTSTVFRTSKQF